MHPAKMFCARNLFCSLTKRYCWTVALSFPKTWFEKGEYLIQDLLDTDSDVIKLQTNSREIAFKF